MIRTNLVFRSDTPVYLYDTNQRRRAPVTPPNDQRLLVASGQKESAPETGALPKFITASGSDLGRLDLQKLAGARDWDRPRLHRLRNLAHEVDV